MSALSEEETLICEFCGFPILDPEQECAALDDGRCEP
ncbi:hypothetical protein J2753_001755 [Halolamina salifodinae]|uniref:Uncharacterized protein n=1 Tax=Halolamina salifodinae TaxID=1202767 RepID=A0A8T4GW87_9EURY|nr:hypothetical protein [Halolamina salifodinae]